MDLSEVGLNHGIELDQDATDGDQVIPVTSLPDVRMMPEVTAHDLFQEVIPGEVPELKEDLNIIGANSAALEDLDYLLADLKRAGGMSQSFATEAKRLYPEFDKQSPLGYYTQQASATRYRISLESLFQRLKESFKELIRKLRELLRRFALWLVGSRDTGGNLMNKTDDQIKSEVESVTQRAEERNQTLEQDMHDLQVLAKVVLVEVSKGIDIRDQHGDTQHVSDFDKLVAHYLYDTESAEEVRQFMEGRNPIFHDIIEEGPWTKATEGLVDIVNQSLSVMMQKSTALLSVVSSSGSAAFADQMVNGRTLEILNQRLEVSFQGRKMNLQDVSTHYNRIYNEASQGEPQKHLSFEQVFGRMAQALATGPTKRLIETGRDVSIRLLTIEKYLDLLEVQIGNVVTDGADGMPDHSTAQPLREALDAIRTDVRDLAMVSVRMNAYRSIVETMSARVVGFAYRLATAIYRDMQVSKEESKAPEVIRELAQQAARMRDKHYRTQAADALRAAGKTFGV
jgi:hypothetical protein